MRKLNKWLVILIATLLVGAAGLVIFSLRNSKDRPPTQSHPTYSLNLASGTDYPVSQTTQISFDIRDQSKSVLKDFDVVHEKQMHLIVVRKDRTNFQHVHPNFDESSGTFSLGGLTFPTDGDYRIFADFTPTNAQKDEMGRKHAATPYQDVRVGDLSKYTPQPLGSDRLTSSANDFETGFFITRDDDSPEMLGATFYPAQNSLISIYVNKNGQVFNNLQPYLGALGHMVVLGPDLEFIHAHPSDQDIANQSGLVLFNVNFPYAGQYKLFLQFQTDNQVITTDYTVTVKDNPTTN